MKIILSFFNLLEINGHVSKDEKKEEERSDGRIFGTLDGSPERGRSDDEKEEKTEEAGDCQRELVGVSSSTQVDSIESEENLSVSIEGGGPRTPDSSPPPPSLSPVYSNENSAEPPRYRRRLSFSPNYVQTQSTQSPASEGDDKDATEKLNEIDSSSDEDSQIQTLRYCVFFPSPQKKTTSDSAAEAEVAENNLVSSQDVDEGFDETD